MGQSILTEQKERSRPASKVTRYAMPNVPTLLEQRKVSTAVRESQRKLQGSPFGTRLRADSQLRDLRLEERQCSNTQISLKVKTLHPHDIEVIQKTNKKRRYSRSGQRK